MLQEKTIATKNFSLDLKEDGRLVRSAREEDLPAVLNIFFGAVRLMRSKGIGQWDEFYPDQAILSEDICRKEMFLLEEDGIPVSAFVLNGEQMEEYGAVPWKFSGQNVRVIHRLCVDASKQGRGLGKLSLLCAEEILRDRGCGVVRLDAYSKNPAALKLYESSGYRRAGKMMIRKGLFYCYEKILCPLRTKEENEMEEITR